MIDAPLHVSLAGLRFTDHRVRSPRDLLDWAARSEVRGVTLDATAPTIRPRELDRSARRDLAATLRRLGLRFAGIDLWIPPEHFARAEHVDRAIAATLGAIDLAAELCKILDEPASSTRVSLELPEAALPDVERTLLAPEHPIKLADHRLTPTPTPTPTTTPTTKPVSPTALNLSVGVDAATHILAGRDPIAALTAAASRGPVARVSDATTAGRAPLGQGRLDLTAYKLASLASGTTRAVLDLRGLHDAEAAIALGVSAWAQA